MHTPLELAIYEYARHTILALLFQEPAETYPDAPPDFLEQAKWLYDAKKDLINRETNLDSVLRSKLLELLNIVIAEKIFRTIGGDIMESHLTKISITMKLVTEKFNESKKQVKLATDTPSATEKDSTLNLLIHLNSRILHNLAIIRMENKNITACDKYIHDWSWENAEAILSTHCLTETIAKNCIQLITFAKERTVPPPIEFFPKCYFPCDTDNQTASTETLLTFLFDRKTRFITLNQRLYQYYRGAQAAADLPDDITREQIEELLKAKAVPDWTTDRKSEIFTGFRTIAKTLPPLKRLRWLQQAVNFECAFSFLYGRLPKSASFWTKLTHADSPEMTRLRDMLIETQKLNPQPEIYTETFRFK